MTSMDLPVSIIMASYNYAEWMTEAINSVIMQTYPHWELIIVDDGSKDDSVDVIREYACRDPRIRLVQHPDAGNHGLPATIKLGLSEAQYTITAFLEADDLWMPAHLELLMGAMQNDGIGMAVCQCEPFGNGIRYEAIIHHLNMIRQSQCCVYSHMDLKYLFLFKHNLIPTFSAVMARTDLLKKCDFDTPVLPWLDYWLWTQMVWMSNCVFISDKLTRWRIHDTSYMSTTRQKTEHSDISIFQKKLSGKIRQKFLGETSFKEKYLLLIGTLPGRLSTFLYKYPADFNKLFTKCSRNLAKAYKFFCKVCICLRTPTGRLTLLKKGVSAISKGLIPDSIFSSFHEQAALPGTPERQLVQAPKRVLFVLHELSLTGAPIVTLAAVRVLRQNGYSPAVMAFRGGGLAAVLQSEGIPHIIEPSLEWETNIPLTDLDFFNAFDAIILSSLSCAPVLRTLRYAKPAKFWWIHETQVGFFHVGLTPNLRLAECFDAVNAVWLGSPLSRPYALEYCPEEKCRLLSYGVPAQVGGGESTDIAKQHIKFLMVGSIIHRKRPDLFVEAIELLDANEKARFKVIGDAYFPDTSAEFTRSFRARAAKNPSVEVCPGMTHEAYLDELKKADVLVCPSSDDPMPVVVTEALMLGKLCICSNAIGQAAILKDGHDIMIFPSGSAEALAEAMSQVINQPEILQKFTEAARQAYHAHFSMEKFEEHLMSAFTVGLSAAGKGAKSKFQIDAQQ